MRRLSRREQVLVALCVLVALFLGGPALWEAVSQRGPSPAQSAQRLRTAHKQRAAAAAALAKLQGDLQGLAARRPPSTLSARAAEELVRRAAVAGIRMRDLKPLPPRPVQGATALPLQLSFAAPFPQAARFLASLRANPGGLAVDRAAIAANTSDSNQVSVNLRVLVFSLSQETQEKRRGKS